MISTKKQIQQLASILLARRIVDVVISPGSRNGPLVHTFVGSKKFNCRLIVDERSAGYFALGLAQVRQKAVVLVCTSGTAALNYAPAVAEAFYQNIPLIVLTADRPEYLIDQGENQTIRQENIYRNFCKKQVNLPMEESDTALWYGQRLINEALHMVFSGSPGPVHLNIPLEEPLHQMIPKKLPPVKMMETAYAKRLIQENEWTEVIRIFNQAEKIWILAGQQPPDSKLEMLLGKLTKKTGAIVLKEHLANLNLPVFSCLPDLVFTAYLHRDPSVVIPDLIITFGGAIVSKSLKQFLKKNRPVHHWHLSLSDQYCDTYQSLTRLINMEAIDFLQQITERADPKSDNYYTWWKEQENRVKSHRDKYIAGIDFCDLRIFHLLSNHLPENTIVHLGNSSPVRYALVCDAAKNVEYYGNRGTSGIDGSLSAAVGFASESTKLNTVILGDLSFFYDSNALWNKYLGANLRIIVIHNGGGNLFSLIDGTQESPAFREYFLTENKTSAEGLAQTFGLDYIRAEDETSFNSALLKLYAPAQQNAVLLEVFTNPELNASYYRKLLRSIY
ncbi:MAG: 2-succinyl-5-enolpyruvyl-6-hydroxy-3-cyclohexene-1-carboxylic-acid synthase [Mariniphaga sp.]|nr:2-succinyl-5-enolpyruvyl-6-hydroxy-3-cyclohexene-1-carboxylic-acid synthase [Mariniphaga sp.]